MTISASAIGWRHLVLQGETNRRPSSCVSCDALTATEWSENGRSWRTITRMRTPGFTLMRTWFYTDSNYINNVKCNYFIEDTFVDNFKRSGSFDRNFSMFHLNIKSLPKNHDELVMYLNSLKFPFSFIGLTETWLDENKENLYDVPQYISVTRYRKTKRGGGVSFFYS